MLTILAFVNFIGALFNCTLCIFIFSVVDELEFKPEKANELSDTLSKYFPVELFILSFTIISALFLGNWFQLVFCCPIWVYNIHFFVMKKYKIYYAIGETKRDYVDLSFSYKIKFVYYMILSFFNLIKLIITATNMVSYNLFGDTNFFTNIIKLIGFY